jgi:hypothetical protein
MFAAGGNLSSVPVMSQEPLSSVKHINWMWPDCLVGDGQPRTLDSARGVYNVRNDPERPTVGSKDTVANGLGKISIRQNYRLNGRDHYTIFDLPISVTNRIEPRMDRPSCEQMENPMLSPDQINVPAANSIGVLFAPGDNTVVQTKVPGSGIGGGRPQAGPGDGLGNGAGVVTWHSGACLLSAASVAWALLW